jgi:hypothetical protein
MKIPRDKKILLYCILIGILIGFSIYEWLQSSFSVKSFLALCVTTFSLILGLFHTILFEKNQAK